MTRTELVTLIVDHYAEALRSEATLIAATSKNREAEKALQETMKIAVEKCEETLQLKPGRMMVVRRNGVTYNLYIGGNGLTINQLQVHDLDEEKSL